MANNLKISILGTLDVNSTVTEINTKLVEVQRKINNVQINVQISPQTQTALNNLTQQVQNLGNANTTRATQNASNQINNVGNAARQSSRHVQTFGQSLQSATQKFGLWLVTANLIYAPIRALQDMTQRLIEIDTLMTDIRRVMDMPDFAFTQLLEDAVETSDQLSSKLSDVLKVMGDFGRMGFNEDQLVDITKTAQVLQNISDLDATQAVDTLTSAMLNFNIAADDSITIANKLNEVDNNFAISTKDLSDGIRKAAATAKTFGVDINELTGYIAAIGSTTRESGSIVGNGLKTIFSRITTIDGAEAILNSANVAMRDMAGSVRPVSDIITDLAANWTELSDEQRQNLGVTLAGRFQLTRFLALMNNFEIAQSATATAIDSSGSAMREQAEYADSLEARLNRLDTAWNKFTLAIGEAVLTDGLIGGIESLNDLATGVATLVDKFGLLSGAFGIIGVATVALSTKFRTFTASLLLGTQGMTRMQLASAGLAGTMGRLSVAMVGVKTALRGLLASTVVGAVFVALGFALEKLIGKYSEAKQAQEEFDQAQQKGIDALTTNGKQTRTLIDQYNAMTEAKKRAGESWSVEQEEKFLSLQEQLAELYPQLVSYIDASGRKHLKNKEQINEEVKATEKLVAAKKEEMKLRALDNLTKVFDERNEIGDDLSAKQKQIDEAQKSGFKGRDFETAIAKGKSDIASLQYQWSQAAQKITGEVLKVADAYISLQIDPNIRQSVDDFVSSLDLSNLNPEQLEIYAKRIGETINALQTAYEAGDKVSFDKSKQSLVDYARKMGATELQARAFALSFDDITKAAEQGAAAIFAGKDGMDGIDDSAVDATGAVDGLASGMEGLAGVSEDVSKAFEGNISALEIFFGITGDQIQQIQNAINVYRALGNQANLTAHQQALLTHATGILGNAFPYLNGKIDENIDWMATQAQVMGAIGEISGDEASTLINNQNESTRVTIAGINSRIQGYKEEAAALVALMDTLVAEMELRGQSGFRLDSYNRAKARLAELQGLIAEAQTELGNIIYNDAVDLGIIKPDGSTTGGGSGDSDAERAAEEAARQREQFLDDVVDLYKDAYGKQQDIALDALEKEKQAFESAHEAKIKKLDEQLELYEDIIQAQMDSIDKQEEEESYAKRLRDAQKSRQEILDEINKLQLDNSFASRKRIDELQVQLAESNSSITDMQHEREVQQRKDNLQSMLDSKRAEIEGQKETEQTTYDNGMRFFETRQAEIERYYDNLINDERYFAKVRTDILSGSNQQVLQDLHKFHLSMAEGGAVIGESIAQNIVDMITQTWGKIVGGNFTPLKQFHEGGVVGVSSPTNRLTQLANKLFNVKPGEQVIKSLVGELQVPPKNIPNLFTNINGMVSSLLSNRNNSNGGSTFNINFNVAKMTGNKDDVNYFMNQIVKGVNALGGKM